MARRRSSRRGEKEEEPNQLQQFPSTDKGRKEIKRHGIVGSRCPRIPTKYLKRNLVVVKGFRFSISRPFILFILAVGECTTKTKFKNKQKFCAL
jgi:hypothetical protein